MVDAGAGHTAVLLPQVLAALNIRASGTYLDATFGRADMQARFWRSSSLTVGCFASIAMRRPWPTRRLDGEGIRASRSSLRLSQPRGVR